MSVDNKIKKTIEYYNQHADTYSEKIEDKIPKKQINYFLAQIKENGKILDVGCAAGRDSREIKKNGFKTIGIDLSDGLLSIARKKDPESKYLNMDMRDLQFEDLYFDGVYAAASLIHLENLQDVIKTIKEFNRVLRERGILFISLKEKIGKNKFEEVKEKRSDGFPRYFQYFTQEEIRRILQNNKFRILKIDTRKSSRGKAVSWIDIFCQKLT